MKAALLFVYVQINIHMSLLTSLLPVRPPRLFAGISISLERKNEGVLREARTIATPCSLQRPPQP